MAAGSQSAFSHLQRLLDDRDAAEALRGMESSSEPLPPRIPGASLVTPEALDRRWALLSHAAEAAPVIRNSPSLEVYAGNIENLIGTVSVPVGLAGPLRVNSPQGSRDFYVPLATTEAALVASYTRGCQVIGESGGCAVITLAEGVSRAPAFVFDNLREAGAFVAWALEHQADFVREAEATTRHGKLLDMRCTVEGNHVYLNFEFHTGDASGQNMVTIATQAICDFIAANTPVTPRHLFVESNLSGDKKASAQSFQTVRGRKVTAETLVPAGVLQKRLHVNAATMEEYWRVSALGGVQSGTVGVQGHYANGLAALFLATGQDVACVSEAAVGITRFEARTDGSLYAAVTLPNLIVGTVGGGTRLPTQSACLDILGLRGAGNARTLAEVAAALALAGELSIIAALGAGHFTRAHKKLARHKHDAE